MRYSFLGDVFVFMRSFILCLYMIFMNVMNFCIRLSLFEFKVGMCLMFMELKMFARAV